MGMDWARDVKRALAARKALGNRLCVAGLARAVPAFSWAWLQASKNGRERSWTNNGSTGQLSA